MGQKAWLTLGSASFVCGNARRSKSDICRVAYSAEGGVNGVIVAEAYLPNGSAYSGPKFRDKLAWFERLIGHASGLWKSV